MNMTAEKPFSLNLLFKSMSFTNKLSIEEYLNFLFQSFLFDWLKEVGTTKEELRLGSRENGEQFVMMAGI